MSLRLPSLLERPIGFAHRGARAHAPENTVAAFDLALRLGATGIESDVWLSSDGQLMLDHDGKIGLRRKPLASFERSDLPDHMITLPELDERVAADIDLSIDVKDDAAMVPLLEWAGTLPLERKRRLWLCHHDWEKLAGWRELDPDVRFVDSSSLKSMEHGPERRAHQLSEAGIDAVNLRRIEWTGGTVTLFHRFERVCFGWDAQHARVIGELLRMGIDGVFSDHVDIMTETLNQHLAADPN